MKIWNLTSRLWESEEEKAELHPTSPPAGGPGKVEKPRNSHNNFQRSSGKTMLVKMKDSKSKSDFLISGRVKKRKLHSTPDGEEVKSEET